MRCDWGCGGARLAGGGANLGDQRLQPINPVFDRKIRQGRVGEPGLGAFHHRPPFIDPRAVGRVLSQRAGRGETRRKDGRRQQ